MSSALFIPGGGPAPASATQPALSVAGRTDGEAYTVTAGDARSLAITADAGATLSTTVVLASTGSPVSVTGAATAAPSWSAPAAAAGGDSYQVQVVATLDGLTSAVSFTERVTGTTSGGAWVTLVDYDLTDLTTTSALSTGSTTLSFDSIADTIDVIFSIYSGGTDITVTPINGTGIVYDGGTDTTSTGTLSFRPSDWLASYTADDVQQYPYAVTFAFTADFSNSYGNAKFYCGVNIGTNSSHNTGDSRHIMVTSDAGGVNETIKIRTNTTESATLATQAIRASRTVTAVIHFGEIVQIIDSSGLTPPTIDVGQVAGTYVAGSDAVGRDDTSRVYQDSSGIRAFLSCGNTADLTLSRVIVQRYE